MIKRYFSTVKILVQRPTHISAVATVLLITKTFTHTDRQTESNLVFYDQSTSVVISGRREREREREREWRGKNE